MKKPLKSIKIFITVISLLFTISAAFAGCAWFNNWKNNFKGELIGNAFTVHYYDNYGNNFLNVTGRKIGVENVKLKNKEKDTEGNVKVSYTDTSVLRITADGNEMSQVGNSVIFAEQGLEPVTDFALNKDINTSGGTLNIIDRNINKLKNLLGKKKTIILESQFGTPVAVYQGDDVYWEVPKDLPKMTKLSVDGKALYLHRVNYVILDTNMIQ